jgi:hypothetical protein
MTTTSAFTSAIQDSLALHYLVGLLTARAFLLVVGVQLEITLDADDIRFTRATALADNFGVLVTDAADDSLGRKFYL